MFYEKMFFCQDNIDITELRKLVFIKKKVGLSMDLLAEKMFFGRIKKDVMNCVS